MDRRTESDRMVPLKRIKELIEATNSSSSTSTSSIVIPCLFALVESVRPSHGAPATTDSNNESINALLIAVKIVPLLVQIVKESLKKVVVANMDGVLALHLLITLASPNHDLNLIDQHKLFPSFQAGSFLFSKAIFQIFSNSNTLKLDKRTNIVNKYEKSGDQILKNDILLSISNIFRQLSEKYPVFTNQLFSVSSIGNKKAEDGRTMEPGGFLVGCLLHCGSEEHRKRALTDISALATQLSVSNALLDALKDFTFSSASVLEAKKKEIASDFKSSSAEESKPNLTIIPPSRFRALLSACLPSVTEIPNQGISSKLLDNALLNVLFLSSHPLVSENSLSLASNCFNKALPYFQLSYQHLDSSSSSTSTSTKSDRNNLIFEAIYSKAISLQNHLRESAKIVLKLLLTEKRVLNSGILTDKFPFFFVNFAIQQIPVEELFRLSEEDLSVYANPTEHIASAIRARNESINESLNSIKITNADRKKSGPISARKGQFGTDLADDEDWVERLKKVSFFFLLL